MAGLCAIELKTMNTNYRCVGAINKTRPITKNVEKIIEDIEKLKKSKYKYRMMIFVVFPLPGVKKPEWISHLDKIRPNFKELNCMQFKFKNGIPGVIYYGFIKSQPA